MQILGRPLVTASDNIMMFHVLHTANFDNHRMPTNKTALEPHVYEIKGTAFKPEKI